MPAAARTIRITQPSVPAEEPSTIETVASLAASFDAFNEDEAVLLLDSPMKRAKGTTLLSRVQLTNVYLAVISRDIGSKSIVRDLVQHYKTDKLLCKLQQDEANQGVRGYKPLLSKKEMLQARNYRDKHAKVARPASLDPWQEKFVDEVFAGRSMLVVTAPSCGKTDTAVGLMEYMLTAPSERLFYVCTSPHLALQVYSNVLATYPERRCISIVTDVITSIAPDSNIVVGTAIELDQYLTATDDKFEVGIFDEAHTLSPAGSSTYDMHSAKALTRLLARCTRSVYALSATLNDTPDEQGVSDTQRLRDHIQRHSGVPELSMQMVVHMQRTVPKSEHVFDDATGTIQPLTVDAASPVLAPPSVTPGNVFKLLENLRDRGMLPGLVFTMGRQGADAGVKSEQECWNMFVSLVKFLDAEEQREYKRFHDIAYRLNDTITEVNEELRDLRTRFQAGSVDGSRKHGSRGANIGRAMDDAVQKRERLLENIIKLLKNEIVKTAAALSAGALATGYAITDAKATKTVRAIMNLENVEHAPDNLIMSPELRDLVALYTDYSNSFGDDGCSDEVPQVEQTRGSFFRLSTQQGNINVFRDMRKPGDNEEKWKYRKLMQSLCAAENVSERDVEGVVDLMIQGLEFGFGIILPTLPFVVQYQVMDMLKKKSLACVFASESMWMGINYSLHSVVLISPYHQPLAVYDMIQMAGRSGRRGKDKHGYVVFWGVPNSRDADVAKLRPLTFPEAGAAPCHRRLLLALDRERVTSPDYIEPPVRIVGNHLGLPNVELVAEVARAVMDAVCKEAHMAQGYALAESINAIMRHLHAAHTSHHTCKHRELMDHIRDVFVCYNRVQYRLLKLV